MWGMRLTAHPAVSSVGARPAPRPPVSGPLAESPCPVATRVKQQFWPSVPDPANSSLGKWVPVELQQVRPGWLFPPAPTPHPGMRGMRPRWDGEWGRRELPSCAAPWGAEGLHPADRL